MSYYDNRSHSPASAPPTPRQPVHYHYTQLNNQYGQNMQNTQSRDQFPPLLNDYTVELIDVEPLTDTEIVWTMGRTVKWIAIVDTIFSVIYSIVLWPYLIASFLSLSGWYGAKNFRPNFVTLYIVYQFLTIMCKLFFIYYKATTSSVILSAISILIEIYIIQITYKFNNMLKDLPEDDRKELQEGWQPNRRVEFAFY